MSNSKLLDAILRTTFAIFIKAVFKTLNPGQRFVDNWHIKAIAHHLEQVQSGQMRRLLITMPPRSLKSICTSVAWPAFLLGHNPNIHLICVSYSQTLSAKFARDFRKVIESEWYQRIFPQVRLTKVTESEIETDRGGCRFATSIDGTVTGFGADIIIIDDPTKASDAQSMAAHENVQETYRTTLMTRLNDQATGAVVIVMQRLHEEDLGGHFLRQYPNRRVELKLPAIAEEDESIPIGNGKFHERKVGDFLDPIRAPKEILDEIRDSMGSANFAAQYQQSPVPADGNLLKRQWLKTWTRLPERSECKITQSWDTAMKGTAGADYSVCTTWLEHSGNHYLIDVFRERLDFPALVITANDQLGRHHPHAVLVEDMGSGTSLLQYLRARPGVPAIERKPDKDKIVRFDRALPQFESGKVYFPEEASWLPDFLKELLAFPSGRFDDQVDSVSQYLNWAFEQTQKTMFHCDWLRDDDDPTPGDLADWVIEHKRYG